MERRKLLSEINRRLEVMHLLSGFIIIIEPDWLYFFISKLSLRKNGDLAITHRIRI
jgi:hypothetical protein